MSFSDMMSSERGPGVIGTLMGATVMSIFVMLFMFAFNDDMLGGGKSIKAVIRDQSEEINNLQLYVAEGRKNLGQIDDFELARKLTRASQVTEQRLADLSSQVDTAEAGIENLVSDAAAYKESYRTMVRSDAKGTVILDLVLQGGKTYKNAVIHEVNPVGIDFRLDTGPKRIRFEDLPVALQVRFQFDPDEQARAVAAESAIFDQHLFEAGIADQQAEVEKGNQQLRDAARARNRLLRKIAEKQYEIALLKKGGSMSLEQMHKGRDRVDGQASPDQLRSMVIEALNEEVSWMKAKLR